MRTWGWIFAVTAALALCWAQPVAARVGSVDGLADALLERIRPSLANARDCDVLLLVRSPWARLGDDLARLLVSRLRAAGVRSADPVLGDDSGAGAAAGGEELRRAAGGDLVAARRLGYERVVRVTLELAAGRLRASGEVIAVGGGPWGAPDETRAHLHLEVSLDDELRAYGPATVNLPPVVNPVVRSVPLGDAPLLAIDVGDADGDGRPVVVGVTADEVIGWRIDGARALERFRLRLDGRAPAQRPRADLGTVVVERGELTARSTATADAVRRQKGVSQPARGFHFAGLLQSCELSPGVDWFTPESCGAATGELPDRFWTAAALRRTTPGAKGGSNALAGVAITAAIVPGSGGAGVLWLRTGVAAPVQVRGVGAQVAIAALSRGVVVATSEPCAAGEPDSVVLRAASGEAPVLQRVERLSGTVRALAGGDVDGDGRDEILAVVRDDAARRTELWIIP